MNLLARRRSLMAASGDEGGLPSEYQQVEWISNEYFMHAGSEYIALLTGQNATYQTELGARIMALAQTGSLANKGMVASRPASTGNVNAFMITPFSSTGKYGFGFFGQWYQCINPDNDWHDYVIANDGLKIDGIVYATPNVSSGDTTKTIVFFAENSGTSMSTARGQKLAYAYIKQNGVLVGQYYPCYRKSDNAIGLFNTVDKTFLSVMGDRSKLTKGSDVN